MYERRFFVNSIFNHSFFAASLKVHEKQTDAMACGHEQRAGRA